MWLRSSSRTQGLIGTTSGEVRGGGAGGREVTATSFPYTMSRETRAPSGLLFRTLLREPVQSYHYALHLQCSLTSLSNPLPFLTCEFSSGSILSSWEYSSRKKKVLS